MTGESGEMGINTTETQRSPLTFEQKLDNLTKANEQGPAEVTDPKFLKLIGALKMPQNQTQQGIQHLIDQGNQWYYASEDNSFDNQWERIGRVIAEKQQETGFQAVGSDEGEGKLERIAKAVEEQAANAKQMAGKKVEKLPEDKNERRREVITMIEKIESNDSPLNRTENSSVASNLERMMDQMEPELAREIRARLRLHDCFTTISAISGTTKDMIGALRGAATELGARDRLLEPEDFDTLFKQDLNGLEISKAFGLLQDAAFKGVILIKGEETRTLRYLGKGQSAQENDMLMDILVETLGGDKNAKKSLQLAVRLAKTTFETAVWDRDNVGSSLSECIHFKKFRTGRWEQARDRGPDKTISKIEGFGTSYLRQASLARKEKDKEGEDKTVPLVPDIEGDKFEDFKGERDPQVINKIKVLLKRKGYYPSGEKTKDAAGNEKNTEWQYELTVTDYNYLGLKQGDYGSYLSNILPRYLTAKEHLLQTSWEPKEFTTDKIESYMAPFKTSDPDGSLSLNAWFVYGALDSSLKEGTTLGWGGFELSRAMSNLTNVVRFVSEEDSSVKDLSFLTMDEAKWVYKALKIYLRIPWLVFQRSLSGIVRTKS